MQKENIFSGKTVFSSDTVLLHGGGIDSSVLLWWYMKTNSLLDRLGVVHVDYGHRASAAEYDAIRRQVSHCEKYFNVLIPVAQMTVSHPIISEQASTNQLFTGRLEDPVEMPNRNGILAYTVATLLSSARSPGTYRPVSLALGIEPVHPNRVAMTDCTHDYLDELNRLIHKRMPNVVATSPLLNYTYREYLLLQHRTLHDMPTDYVKNNIMTCWNPIMRDGKWMDCGECAHCKKKHALYTASGLNFCL